MAARDRAYWDTVYRAYQAEAQEYPAPNPLLFMYTPPVLQTVDQESDNVPCALDLAAGLGQNGLWLASQGYSVDLVDISRVGLMLAQNEAAERGVRHVNFLQTDLDDSTPLAFAEQRPQYDVLAIFQFFRRDLIRDLRAAVKPGGRVICETWNVHALDVDTESTRESLLEPGELAGYFADWHVLRHADVNGMSQIVAIKP